MSRLPSGGLIDRGNPLSFTFDGKTLNGFAGDTLASALIANDVKLAGRSFKYHRPRGIMTAGSEEPNALVTLRGGAYAEPNTRATVVPLFEGLEATSQNRWPSLSFDLMAVNQLAAPLFVAGFYYKTFMWPASFWEKLYEPLIRRAAGLGALSGLPDPDRYDRTHGFCDLLVIGAGPAGIAAALVAGRAGLRVIVAEADHACGGRLLSEKHMIDGDLGAVWVEASTAELDTMPNVTMLRRTTVFGVYDDCEYGAVEQISDHLPSAKPGHPRQRLWKITAKRALLATGAIERPLIFSGNDRPGVMMAASVSTYLNRFAAAPGTKAAIFTTTDSGWRTARDLVDAGIEVAAIIDARSDMPAAAQRFEAAGIRICSGGVVSGTEGKTLRSIVVKHADGQREGIAVDLLAVSGGWDPAIGLGSNLGGRPAWSDDIHSFLLVEPPPGMIAIGAAAGHFALRDIVAKSICVADDLTAEFGFARVVMPAPRIDTEAVAVSPFLHVKGKAKAFVDFQHDVTDADIALAAREGFVSVEHLKRYTTLGMATDQGKTSQVNGHALLAAATGKSIAEAGTILSRPPYLPVSIGVLAGHHRDENFKPERRTSSYDWAVEQGATFVDAGQWKRAQWFARSDERDWIETVSREVNATRGNVGICDVSTLGKIEVHGPDAGTLLDRLYINTFSSLPVGKARYGVMLREDGFVMDDGSTTRFAEDFYFVTTTTVNAAKVMQHIDYARQVLWPRLDVQATSVTEQWATYSVAGPQSRALISALLSDVDVSNEGFPFMTAAEVQWKGITARLFRLSFSGELAYEISVPASHGDALIRVLFAVGQKFGVVPYGTEALSVMRIEKGHVAGNELNGQTTAGDLGLTRLMSKKKDFIGRIMADRPGLTESDRPTLVGIRPTQRGTRVRAGSHLLPTGAAPVAANDQGYVTSAAFSPTLGHWIGLALLQRGPQRHGEHVVMHDPIRSGDIEVEICGPVFVDPEGICARA